MELRGVSTQAQIETVRELFREYKKQIGVDLCFQGFAAELLGLPGDYAEPTGTLILAAEGGMPAGCVAVRAWSAEGCEMKRLYVRPAFQGTGTGRRLAEAVIVWAREHGYARILLDTLPSMKTAQQLYERLGFKDIEPYRANPVAGARYMALTV